MGHKFNLGGVSQNILEFIILKDVNIGIETDKNYSINI